LKRGEKGEGFQQRGKKGCASFQQENEKREKATPGFASNTKRKGRKND